MEEKCITTLGKHKKGQSMVEFALLLPLFVLLIIGIFDLGRAFFSFIAITNAAREGARVITFWPGDTQVEDVETAVLDEIGASPMVTEGNIQNITIECGILYNVTDPANCPTEEPVRVTVTYNFDLIFNFLFNQPLTLRRSAEMMMP
jgi:Flp pilus assembly protein TadG